MLFERSAFLALANEYGIGKMPHLGELGVVQAMEYGLSIYRSLERCLDVQ